MLPRADSQPRARAPQAGTAHRPIFRVPLPPEPPANQTFQAGVPPWLNLSRLIAPCCGPDNLQGEDSVQMLHRGGSVKHGGQPAPPPLLLRQFLGLNGPLLNRLPQYTFRLMGFTHTESLFAPLVTASIQKNIPDPFFFSHDDRLRPASEVMPSSRRRPALLTQQLLLLPIQGPG